MSTIEKGKIAQKFHYDYEFEWSIENFESSDVSDYRSPTFSVPGSEWSLIISRPEDSDYFGSLGLYVLKKSVTSMTVDFSFSTKKKDGNLNVLCRRLNEKIDAELWIHGDLTLDPSHLLPSGDLTIVCFLRIHDCLAESLLKLSTDYENMFKSKSCCDVTLRIQNEEIPVHKSVLASRSPVFEAMFEVDMTEKNTGVVDIVDCHPQAFKDFLVYIYSGKLENSFGDIFGLYKIAHKYDTRELKSACVCYIKNNLSVDTVIDAAILGDLFHEDELRSEVQDFFVENFAKVVPTQKWDDLLKNSPSVANGLLKDMAKNFVIRKRRRLQ